MSRLAMALASGAIGALNGFLVAYGVLHFLDGPLAIALACAFVLVVSVLIGTGIAHLGSDFLEG